MINGSPIASGHSPLAAPDAQLHIYYLEGRLGPERLADPAYLGTWEEEATSFVFFSQPADEAMTTLLQAHPQVSLIDRYEMSYADWQGARPAPLEVGPFRLRPPWETPAEEGTDAAATSGSYELILDPGVVFGTGTHATTRDCLTALAAACTPEPPARVLDLGTGTGVLALAAARLGCQKILAVDNNFLAVRTTLANIRLNHLEDQVLAVQGSAEALLHNQVELLIANIHYDVMVKILSAPEFWQSKQFILSGLMRSEARDIRHRLRLAGARIHREWTPDDIWHTYYGTIG